MKGLHNDFGMDLTKNEIRFCEQLSLHSLQKVVEGK